MSTPFTVQPRPGAALASGVRPTMDAGGRTVPVGPVPMASGPRAPVAPQPAESPSAVWVPQRGASVPESPDEPDAGMRAGTAAELRRTPVRRASVPPPTAGERHPSLVPFAAYLDDPAVTDLFVNGAAGLFVD